MTAKIVEVKRKQPIPDSVFTICPKLDPTVQSRLPKPAKDADREIARLQILVLDAAIPLVNVLEAARKGSLNTKDAAESAQHFNKLLVFSEQPPLIVLMGWRLQGQGSEKI